ncbi:pyruvate,water dikinase [Friedmanniella endophytica]|uniref:Pyruvate,water dikinase n=1 Tax=Microlunatus kandeliicorticis TaxID=1759536 RepID=A0A7W3ITZ9_9ACTN|nr:PEP/pyruvate-binding domain-containing protein [Microlunatus kandeliicorticis]MBA8795204.1 pyruvate,water dikinase [Microlunatus kandeliicorticis]
MSDLDTSPDPAAAPRTPHQPEPLVLDLTELGRDDVAVAGGKGANLGELTRAAFPVPAGFVVTTAAYRRFVTAAGLDDLIVTALAGPGTEPAAAAQRIASAFAAAEPDPELRAAVLDHWRRSVGADEPLAVRSSATAEDLADASFAGQQESYLNVRGADDLLVAIRDCWASLWTERAIAYRARQEVDTESIALAVVVQRLVPAEAAGVMFTANPANGRRDQLVIAASWGLGESVVGGHVDTDEVVVDAASRVVVSRRTADKRTMTVTTEHRTTEQPVPDALARATVLDDAAAAELAGLGLAVQEHFGAPQDLEWTRTADGFALVQSRPITALPEPEGPVPDRWPVEPGSWYFRASIVEQLPDPLTPLFADLIDPAVSTSLREMMSELIGATVVRPEDASLPTVNGYAYYRYSYGGMVRLTLRTPLALMLYLRRGDQGVIPRWREHAHPRYQAAVAAWHDRDLTTVGSRELREGVAALLTEGCAYYTSVQTIIPYAATTEVVLTRFWAGVRRPDEPSAATLLLGFDSAPIRAEKSLWDLAAWARSRPGLAEWLARADDATVLGLLDRSPSEAADGEGEDGEGEDADRAAFGRRFAAHLDTWGHSVYNLDFANAVPADDPAPVLATLRFYLRGEGTDPYARQAAAAERRDRLAGQVRARLDPVRRRVFDRLLRWAQQGAPVREDALADVGLAWPQLRRMLAELGRRLVAAGALERAEQVYWLTAAELDAWIAEDPSAPAADVLAERIAERRRVWRGRRRATPPQGLPVNGAMALMESVMPARSQEAGGSVLRGIGASAGRVTAPARVLAGPEEFGLMQPGEVLVASITTPAWTPLFAMASAVVTDIGGPLSHSSIVAREYGIPAVLGTSEATRRIRSGQPVTVDGDTGLVSLEAEDQDGDPGAGDDRGAGDGRAAAGRRGRAVALGALGAGAVALIVRRRRAARQE